MARQLPQAISLAERCPGVQLILDHCGAPDIAGSALDPWREHIRQLASLPNVACKVSGMLACCSPDNATAAAVKPYVEHCLEQFGWDRVVWGSDWPVCLITSSLKQWVEISLDLTAGAMQAERENLFWRNAERIYLHGEGAGCTL